MRSFGLILIAVENQGRVWSRRMIFSVLNFRRSLWLLAEEWDHIYWPYWKLCYMLSMLILHNLYSMSMEQVLIWSLWLRESVSSPRSPSSEWWRWDMNPDVASLKDWALDTRQDTLENLNVKSVSPSSPPNVCWCSCGPNNLNHRIHYQLNCFPVWFEGFNGPWLCLGVALA